MTLYCGIDLHSDNSMISLIDNNDRLISEKRLDNSLETIHRYLIVISGSCLPPSGPAIKQLFKSLPAI